MVATQHMSSPRLPVVDVARGLAIVAMFVYHFAWDLGFFGFIDLQVAVDPGWRWFARCIAGSFLMLVGVGLVLAERRGLDSAAYLRRLGLIGAAALGITLATWLATPGEFIFFGILHCIAVSSVLALPFLRAPAAVTALAAIFIIVLPAAVRFPALDGAVWLWLGLGETIPPTNDYEPLFPWFGLVLAGVALARFGISAGLDRRLAAWRTNGPVGRLLAWAGRHSLALYLVHQPLFLGALSLAAMAIDPPGRTQEGFRPSCERSCLATGTDAGVCSASCACVDDKLRATDMASRRLDGAATADIQDRIREFALACRREREGEGAKAPSTSP